MKARTIILTITAAALLAAPVTVLAQKGPGHGQGGPGCDGPGFGRGHGGPGIIGMLHRVADKLELTDDQVDQIQSIAEAARAEAEPLREQAQAEREAFREAREPGAFDEPTFRAHFETQAQLHIEMQLIRAESMSEAFNVLTPDQQDELLELIELFHGDRQGPRHSGGKRLGRK